MNLDTRPRWREFYERTAPALAIVILMVALGGVAYSFYNDRVNERQDDQQAAFTEQRAKDAQSAADENARLLACFDTFADTLAGGLPKVREASAERNAALSDVLASLRNLLTTALAAGDEEIPDDQGLALVTDLAAALANYERADKHLLQVQAENPYPDPPSEFCATAS